ncbi:MAG: hypothetical protein HYU66_18135 [Armatimonadetes bacterium]|nr:hypothetical protein [Armatimonadota bacterium]
MMHGLSSLDYPAQGNLDLSAGRLEFDAALSFDTAEVRKNPGLLSNQMFCTIRGPGIVQVCVYSTLGYTNVVVYDPNRQIVCHGNFPGEWKKGEWHHLELHWGRQLELWCDGERRVVKDWFGLFGPIDVKPADLRLNFGSHIGWNDVHSEFTLDEIRILGPGGDELTDHPVMTVPRLAHPPSIDGQVDDKEWESAARATGFVGLNDNALVEDQSAVYTGWDAEALYVAIVCLDPQQRPLRAVIKERDGPVYQEDAVDVILQPEPEPSLHYQFICSAMGTLYDSRVDARWKTSSDTAFNPACTFKTSNAPGRWAMECRIPFKELEGRAAPKAGDRWRANFCRDADSGSRLSSWAYAAGNFHTTANYGELVFTDSDRALRLGDLGDWASGQLESVFALSSTAFQPLVIVNTKLLGGDAKAVAENENRLADYRAVAVKPPKLVTGLYHLVLRAQSDGREMYYQRLPFRVLKPYDITVEGYPYAGKLWVTANAGGLTPFPAGLVARSRLMQGDRVVGECRATRFERGLGEAAIGIADLAPGKYLVRSEALASDGKVLGSADAEFEQLPKPVWWHSQAGLDHSVPWPWTPVQCDGRTIKVLGREYRCGDGSLPRQVTARGTEILAAPVSLQLASGGQTADLAKLRAIDADHPHDASLRVSQGAVGNLAVKLQCTTEFDGLQRYDLTLTPKQAAELTSLVLTVPVKRECATLLLPCTGSASAASLIGDQPWQSGFLPQVWVGNDDLGIAFCAESDQFWHPRDKQMLEVLPAGRQVLLRANIVRQPVKLSQPVTLTFVLLATPVKDGHGGDPFLWRLGPERSEGAFMESLRYPAQGHLTAPGTLEFQFSPAGAPGGSWRDLMAVNAPETSLRMWYLDAPDPQLQIGLREGKEDQRWVFKGLHVEAGRFTHMAVTWGDKPAFYVDGRRVGELDRPLPAALFAAPEKTALRLGCAGDWSGWTSIAVDEVRASRVVRYQGETCPVPSAPFAPDADTLLLDHLDDRFKPDGEDAETRAAKIAGASGGLGGVPSFGCRFVDGRFGGGLEIAVAPAPTMADLKRQYGHNAGLFWFWLETEADTLYGWPSPLFIEPRIPKLRDDVKEANDLGVSASTYVCYPAVGAPSDLSRQFGAEWGRRPLSTQPWEPPPGHYFLDCCAGAQGYADYYAAGTQWTLDELGMEGAYTDGAAQAYGCNNTRHGCGYVDEEGSLHATVPLFAERELLKRMYKLCHRRGAPGYLVNHVSFGLFLPTGSFSDILYSGEHENYEDLVKFRTRWQSGNTGIWTILLGPDAHSWESLHMTYCLLHGTSVWAEGMLDRNDMFRKTANVWQTYDRFGYREARWVPYYRAETGLAGCDRAEAKASLYVRRGQRALVVVGNLKPVITQTTVALDLAALGLRAPKAVNALTGEPLPMAGGKVQVRLRPSSFVLVWVE